MSIPETESAPERDGEIEYTSEYLDGLDFLPEYLDGTEFLPECPDETSPPETAAPSEAGKGRKKHAKRRKKMRRRLSDFHRDNDIRYRGPLSYRAFRILGWLCIAATQVGFMMSIGADMDPVYGAETQDLVLVCTYIGTLAVPFMLFANFATILNTSEGYRLNLLRNGLASAAIIIGSFLIYHRYMIGLATEWTGDRASAFGFAEEILASVSETGYMSYNIFLDLFLCTLLIFFLNYRPARFFVGKRLLLFRLLALLPIVYETVAIVLRVMTISGDFVMPVYLFPFLPVKAPLTFVVFLILAAFLKIRERKYCRGGRTQEEYREFLRTNRNSLHFSVFSAVTLALTGVIDLVALLAFMIFSYHNMDPAHTGDMELAFMSILPKATAMGFGESITLLLLAPFVLLFSYTRTHRYKVIDLFIPIGGLVLILLIYIEGLYQMILMLPTFFNQYFPGGLA